MKKLAMRAFVVMGVLAFAASVAASEPEPANESLTLSCTKSGMTCGSSSQCCSKHCSIPHGRVVGHCS